MKMKQYGGQAALILCAIIWGTAFVAQSTGMRHLGPCGFNAARSFLAGVVMLPCIIILDCIRGRRPTWWGGATTALARRMLLRGGILCGLALAAASLVQQIGIKYTTVTKAGFITTLYIILVPLFGLLLGRRTRRLTWLCAGMSVAGMYLLCCAGESGIASGDLLLLLCAALFACQILVIDHFVPHVDCVRLSCLQFLVVGVVSLAMAALLGEPLSPDALSGAAFEIFYCGVLSSGVAYTLQIIGQKYVHPVAASLLMSTESVFAALSGWLILRQPLTPVELAGCVIIFTAVVIAQIPGRG